MIAKGKAAQAGTASGALLSSGRPVVVYGVNASFSGAGRVILRNGTTATDPLVFEVSADSADDITRTFGGVGLVFANGCYIQVLTDVTSYSIFYEAL